MSYCVNQAHEPSFSAAAGPGSWFRLRLAVAGKPLLLLAVLALPGCGDGRQISPERNVTSASDAARHSAGAATAPSSDDVATVADLLEQMPVWLSADADNQARIETASQRIASYDTATVRAALQAFARRHTIPGSAESRVIDSDAEAKVFALNKYLFAIPASVPRESPQAAAFGGWWGPEPSLGGRDVDLRWPWSEDPSGGWCLTGRARGASAGPPYLGLPAFDCYEGAFGRRPSKRESR